MSAAAQADSDLESFRAEARAWIEANFPKSLKGKDALSFMEGFGSKDPDFLSDAEKGKMEIEPMSGVDAQKIADSIVNTPPAVVARAKAMLGDLLK